MAKRRKVVKPLRMLVVVNYTGSLLWEDLFKEMEDTFDVQIDLLDL